MKRLHLIVPALLVLGLASGCVVRGSAGYSSTAYVRPATVQISPGVYVIEDYHEPVFYSDGWYWRYYGGVWYRSSYHHRGWVRWNNVPRGVARIDRPNVYVRYRANARGNVRGNVRNDRPVVRDNRDNRTRVQPQRDHRPATRDHRGATPVRVQKPNVEHRGSGQVRHKDDDRSRSKGKDKDKDKDKRKKDSRIRR